HRPAGAAAVVGVGGLRRPVAVGGLRSRRPRPGRPRPRSRRSPGLPPGSRIRRRGGVNPRPASLTARERTAAGGNTTAALAWTTKNPPGGSRVGWGSGESFKPVSWEGFVQEIDRAEGRIDQITGGREPVRQRDVGV